MIVLHNPHQGHDNTPSHHDGWEPDARSELLEEQVGRHFESGIGKEEDCQTPVVLVARQAKVFCETLDIGVSNVAPCKCYLSDSLEEWIETDGQRTIEEGQEVEKRKHWDQAHVHLVRFS